MYSYFKNSDKNFESQNLKKIEQLETELKETRLLLQAERSGKGVEKTYGSQLDKELNENKIATE